MDRKGGHVSKFQMYDPQAASSLPLDYPPPTGERVKAAFAHEGGQSYERGNWQLAWVDVDNIQEVEEVEEFDSELVEAFALFPESIPPIQVKYFGGELFQVFDGHHRLQAAKEAGHKAIWVIVL